MADLKRALVSTVGRVIVKKLAVKFEGNEVDTKYMIAGAFIEYKIVIQPDLTRHITMEYQSMAFPYDRVLRGRQIPVNTFDTTWGWSLNMTCRS